MQFLISLITSMLVGSIAGYIGSLMITRRMALVSGPLGHLAFPGVALALLLNFDLFLGALFSILLGAFLIWIFSLKAKAHFEALTAVIFTSMVAIGFLFLPLKNAEEALIGDITKVSIFDLLISFVLSISIFFVIRSIYSNMLLAEISEDLAKSLKVNIKRNDLIYMLCVALIAALEVKLVGGLLTVAMIAIPAASALNLSKNLREYTILSTFFGLFSSISGLLLFNLFNFPAGPMIILSNFFIFFISTLFAKK